MRASRLMDILIYITDHLRSSDCWTTVLGKPSSCENMCKHTELFPVELSNSSLSTLLKWSLNRQKNQEERSLNSERMEKIDLISLTNGINSPPSIPLTWLHRGQKVFRKFTFLYYNFENTRILRKISTWKNVQYEILFEKTLKNKYLLSRSSSLPHRSRTDSMKNLSP